MVSRNFILFTEKYVFQCLTEITFLKNKMEMNISLTACFSPSVFLSTERGLGAMEAMFYTAF